jgi:ribosomal protein L14E/L6E/L27E
MKIDMSRKAVTHRLKTVNQLRKVCLSLANSSAGKKTREQFSANETVQRTSQALGR